MSAIRFRFIFVILLFSSTSFAKVPDYFFEKESDLKMNHTINVLAYDRRLGGVYEIQTTQDKRKRNHYTKLGDLSIAVSKIGKKKSTYKRRPKKLIGQSFKIDKALLKTYKAPMHIN